MEVSQGLERDKGSSSASPTAVVSNFWRDFDLDKERSVLDEQGLRIAENQENSQRNRRKLAESTRDFKKASPEEKLTLFNSLLKDYEEEVDNLTKRAKLGENAFLNIYQKIYEAADPYPALASIAAVGYKTIEAEDWEVAMDGEEMSKLESMLLDKNRKMEHELTQLKVKVNQLSHRDASLSPCKYDHLLPAPAIATNSTSSTSRPWLSILLSRKQVKLSEQSTMLKTSEGKVAELIAKVNEQQRLISKLEDDILKGYSSTDRKGTRIDDWDLHDVGAAELSENAEQKHITSDQYQSSMLRVIWNQRDRFRTRLRETEEADLLRQQMHWISTTRQAARAFLVINDYFSRLRALSALWLARPRD